MYRLEVTLRPDMLAALDRARGHEPRASFVKRVLADALPASGVVDIPAAVALTISPREPSAAELEALDADLVAGEQMRNGAPVAVYRCPVSRCAFSSSSPAAVCGRHGRKVKR